MFPSRIKILQESLPSHEIDALLITSPYNIAYLSGIHAFSIEEREARIIITKKSAYLFTDARYTGMVQEKSPFLKLCEIKNTNPFSKQLNDLIKSEKIKTIGFEEENITYKEAADIEEKFEKVEFIPTVGVVEDLRTVKDGDEIRNVREACILTDKAFEFILDKLTPGVSEADVKARLENFIRLEGGELAFSSIVAFGKNSAIPHHLSSNDCKLRTEDFILLDFGAKVNGYCSDMTRTVFVGQPTAEMKKMYQATKEAQEIAIDYILTHTDKKFELKKAHTLANSHIGTLGFTDIPHSLGHGVGLQVHEEPMVSPYSEEALEAGMIITIEPGVYIPGAGGVRIEDTCLVTPGGLVILTNSPKELIIV